MFTRKNSSRTPRSRSQRVADLFKLTSLEQQQGLAAANDLYSRLSSMKTSSVQFGAEMMTALKSGDDKSLKYFVDRWFFTNEAAKLKTAVYEDVIDQLVGLLNPQLMKGGKRFTRQDLLKQHLEYARILAPDMNDTHSDFSRMVSRPIAIHSRLAPVQRHTSHTHHTLDEILKYPYDEKLELLQKCRTEWHHACTQSIHSALTATGRHPTVAMDQARLQEALDALAAARTQKEKNLFLDAALELTFQPRAGGTRFVGTKNNMWGEYK